MKKPKHVVGKLRQIIGLKQSAFAELVGCSKETIQSIEPQKPRLHLSEKRAARIALETGVDIHWLLMNRVKTAPLTHTGELFTKRFYERHRAKLYGPKHHPAHFGFAQKRLLQLLTRLADIMVISQSKESIGLACYKVDAAFNSISEDLGIDWDDENEEARYEFSQETLDELYAAMAVEAKCTFDMFNSGLLDQLIRSWKGRSKELAVKGLDGREVKIDQKHETVIPK